MFLIREERYCLPAHNYSKTWPQPSPHWRGKAGPAHPWPQAEPGYNGNSDCCLWNLELGPEAEKVRWWKVESFEDTWSGPQRWLHGEAGPHTGSSWRTDTQKFGEVHQTEFCCHLSQVIQVTLNPQRNLSKSRNFLGKPRREMASGTDKYYQVLPHPHHIRHHLFVCVCVCVLVSVSFGPSFFLPFSPSLFYSK